jgi:hypothetical protein
MQLTQIQDCEFITEKNRDGSVQKYKTKTKHMKEVSEMQYIAVTEPIPERDLEEVKLPKDRPTCNSDLYGTIG